MHSSTTHIALIASLIAIMLSGTSLYSFKNKVDPNQLNTALKILRLDLKNPTGIKEWNIYGSEELGFSIAYPNGYGATTFTEKKGIGIQKFEGIETVYSKNRKFVWGVLLFPSDSVLLEDLISDMGKQFSAFRRERRESFELNGAPALRVVVTSTTVPNWKHEQVFVNTDSIIYVISNGAVPNADFELFYNSFLLL
jgi:hypothetical protein